MVDSPDIAIGVLSKLAREIAARDSQKRPPDPYRSSMVLHGAVKALEERYQAYVANPEPQMGRRAFRLLLVSCKELGIPLAAARYLAELGRYDDNAPYTFQLSIARRPENRKRHDIQKHKNKRNRLSLTNLQEQELFFRVLWHRDVANCSLQKAFKAVGDGTAHNLFPEAPLTRRSATTVKRAYMKFIPGYKNRGIQEIELSQAPHGESRTVTLRGRGRPKKVQSAA